jgi:hypothetical protein
VEDLSHSFDLRRLDPHSLLPFRFTFLDLLSVYFVAVLAWI